MEKLRKDMRICLGCLNQIKGERPLTEGHVFPKDIRSMSRIDKDHVPFLLETHQAEECQWVSIDTGMDVEEKPLVIIGPWDRQVSKEFNTPIRSMWIPLCEDCRETERISDSRKLGPRLEHIKEVQVKIRPKDARPPLKEGERVTVEMNDQRIVAKEVVMVKAQMFLRTSCLVSAFKKPTVGWLRHMRANDPERDSIKWNPGEPEVHMILKDNRVLKAKPSAQKPPRARAREPYNRKRQ